MSADAAPRVDGGGTGGRADSDDEVGAGMLAFAQSGASYFLPLAGAGGDPQIGPLFADFLRCALTVDPQLRPSSSELLKHPFVANCATARREKLGLPLCIAGDASAAAFFAIAEAAEPSAAVGSVGAGAEAEVEAGAGGGPGSSAGKSVVPGAPSSPTLAARRQRHAHFATRLAVARYVIRGVLHFHIEAALRSLGDGGVPGSSGAAPAAPPQLPLVAASALSGLAAQMDLPLATVRFHFICERRRADKEMAARCARRRATPPRE